MRTLRKYQFTSEEAANTAILALGTTTDLEGNEIPSNPHQIYKLGHLVETPATYDEEGEVLTEAVLSDTYAVDVVWEGEPLEDWDANMIWCEPIGVFTAGGVECVQEWTAKCKELHPEYFPEPSEELI